MAAAGEAILLARETGQPRWAVAAQLAQATIAAERGDFDAAESLAREAEALLLPEGTTPMLALVQFVRGRGAVAHQRYAEGFEQLRRMLEPADPAFHPIVGAWALADLVEATACIGKKDSAMAYLDQLESLAAATSGSLLRAEAGYARAIVAQDDDAEALYKTALEHDLANWPCYRGRMLLWYGKWLRRQRRVAESRAPLRAAREGFDALAFPKLAESARQELRASGERSRLRTPETWDQLTPQELQIARMAAEGLSNRESGQQLYLSHRTVGYHLHRIFPKLGITSRSQLHAAVLGLTESSASSPAVIARFTAAYPVPARRSEPGPGGPSELLRRSSQERWRAPTRADRDSRELGRRPSAAYAPSEKSGHLGGDQCKAVSQRARPLPVQTRPSAGACRADRRRGRLWRTGFERRSPSWPRSPWSPPPGVSRTSFCSSSSHSFSPSGWTRP